MSIICLIDSNRARVYVRVNYKDVCTARSVTYKGISYGFASRLRGNDADPVEVLGHFEQEHGCAFSIPDDAEVVTP